LHAVLLAAAVLLAGCTNEPNAQLPDDAAGRRAPGEGGTARAAAFVDQTVPAEMAPDQNYTVSVRMRNTGTATWTAAESYRIGSLNPIDNDTWGFRRVVVPAAIAPGAEATFTFALKAPRMPGEYNFQWRMVQEGVEWFGDETPNVSIAVGGAVAKDAK
jgi:hypothetical protein